MKLINGHPTKAALICYVLLKHGPSARIPIMKTVHALEGSKLPFRPGSNKCYWLHDKYNNPWIAHESQVSVLKNGLVKKVGVKDRFHIYDLTPAGRKLALEVVEHYGH